jgi:hypothetical protein
MAQRTRIPTTGFQPWVTPDFLRPPLVLSATGNLPRGQRRGPRLDESTLDHIATELRAHYADLAAQPLPDRIVELMRRLDPSTAAATTPKPS